MWHCPRAIDSLNSQLTTWPILPDALRHLLDYTTYRTMFDIKLPHLCPTSYARYPKLRSYGVIRAAIARLTTAMSTNDPLLKLLGGHSTRAQRKVLQAERAENDPYSSRGHPTPHMCSDYLAAIAQFVVQRRLQSPLLLTLRQSHHQVQSYDLETNQEYLRCIGCVPFELLVVLLQTL